jgi:hypothetical protein
LTGLLKRETLELVIEEEMKGQGMRGGKGGDPVSRKRAIQNTLGRLGMQASNKEVVAALAEIGIGVTEGLVHQVKVEMLKQAAGVERQRFTGSVRMNRQQQVRLPPKLPPSR